MPFSQSLNRLPSILGILLTLVAAHPSGAFGQAQPAPPAAASPDTQPTNSPPQPGQVQQTAPLPPKEEPGVKAPGKTPEGEDKRVLGVLPNYRTAEMNAVGHPLTPEQKLRIAAKDSFDYPLIILGGAYAALYQLENSHPEFGQGLKGYARRFGTSYCDQVDGNIMTEGLFPILLKEDPRYFRMAEGSKARRTWYALSRIVVTRTDAGNKTFNFSEIVGNGVAAGIGLSYYPDNRNVRDYLQNWGTELGTDAVSQVLKEFWPDVKRWWYVRHHKVVR
ncbi:MAG TPA: hypothetical protein VHU83_02765 [Bryobacteraceae bacterium]|jgi:hypothetical protein|nr:hypothetical protein [Bryobacteraceae bacterium]